MSISFDRVLHSAWDRPMCGRYSLSPDEFSEVGIAFEVDLPSTLERRYNIAPGQEAPVVVVRGGARRVVQLRWGLVPAWAKEPRVAFSNINARAETVSRTPAFREAFRSRRCLVPASGFYEWRPIEGQRKKQPHYIGLRDGRVFALAGLWEHWQRGKQVIESFALITTDSNELVMPIHDRMPVILEPESYDLWLDPGTELAVLERLMVPMPADKMSQHPVSTFVNSPNNEGVQCIEVVDAIQSEQGTLPF